jgi:hypothetical protein
MSEEEDGIPAPVKQLVILLAFLILVAAVLTAIDYRLKGQVVAKVAEFTRLTEGSRRAPQPRTERPRPEPAERAAVHDHRPDWLGSNGVDGRQPAAEADGQAVAAPIVQPGDESHRPPRRGSFNA